ncbi:MAG: hypothetical protein HUJ72_01220 [Blautia sp.]|nr:hypothetical protein [Blautia sp.]
MHWSIWALLAAAVGAGGFGAGFFYRKNVAEAKEDIEYMDNVMARIRAINRYNAQLKRYYRDDDRFVRVHKRLHEENEERPKRTPPQKPIISENERHIAEGLAAIKREIDNMVWYDEGILKQQAFFERAILQGISNKLLELKQEVPISDRKYIQRCISNEYFRTAAF